MAESALSVKSEVKLDYLTQKRTEIHKKLNEKIIQDCTPYVPMENGGLRKNVHTEGEDYIVWNSPYAHYQYYGRVYSPNIPIYEKDENGNKTVIIGWFSPPGKKKIPTDRYMGYKTAGTTNEWFNAAKRDHGQEWIEYAKSLYKK